MYAYAAHHWAEIVAEYEMGSGGPGRPPLLALPPARLFALVEGVWRRSLVTADQREKVDNLLKRGTRATIAEVPDVPVPSWFPDSALPSKAVPESLDAGRVG